MDNPITDPIRVEALTSIPDEVLNEIIARAVEHNEGKNAPSAISIRSGFPARIRAADAFVAMRFLLEYLVSEDDIEIGPSS